MRMHVVPLRPDQEATLPVFEINGHVVDPAEVHITREESLWTYKMEFDPSKLRYGEWNHIAIECDTWCPADEGVAPDQRHLGVFMTGLEIDELRR